MSSETCLYVASPSMFRNRPLTFVLVCFAVVGWGWVANSDRLVFPLSQYSVNRD